MEPSKTIIRYKVILYSITLVLGVTYGSSWMGLFDPTNDQNVIRITQFQEDRPYVYRILATAMARGISDLFSLRPDYAIIIVSAVFFVASLWAFQYFASAFPTNTIKNYIFSFAGIFAAFILLMSNVRKVYDPATMFFFALALGLLVRGKYMEYYLLFPLATLNRETTFLLTLFFAVYFFSRLPTQQYFWGLVYQGVVYLMINRATAYLFAHNGGKSFYFLDFHVYKTYLEKSPLVFLVILTLLGGLFFLVPFWFHNRSAFLNIAFLCMFPAQIILHFLFGYPYEFRVFLELFPIFVSMFVITIPLPSIFQKALE